MWISSTKSADEPTADGSGCMLWRPCDHFLKPHSKNPIASRSWRTLATVASVTGLSGDLGSPTSRPIARRMAFVPPGRLSPVKAIPHIIFILQPLLLRISFLLSVFRICVRVCMRVRVLRQQLNTAQLRKTSSKISKGVNLLHKVVVTNSNLPPLSFAPPLPFSTIFFSLIFYTNLKRYQFVQYKESYRISFECCILQELYSETKNIILISVYMFIHFNCQPV